MGASPQATLTFGQCALGLTQVKAVGLVEVFNLGTASTSRVVQSSPEQSRVVQSVQSVQSSPARPGSPESPESPE